MKRASLIFAIVVLGCGVGFSQQRPEERGSVAHPRSNVDGATEDASAVDDGGPTDSASDDALLVSSTVMHTARAGAANAALPRPAQNRVVSSGPTVEPDNSAEEQAVAPMPLENAATQSVHMPAVRDWTQHHLIFTNDYSPEFARAAGQEYRVVQSMMDRAQQALSFRMINPIDSDQFSQFQRRGLHTLRPIPPRFPRKVTKPDWNITLGAGAVPANQFPAKYTFDINAAPSCANDYVVYGLNVAGVTGGQANLVGFNNLYSGTLGGNGLCGTGTASVMWAYNIGGGKVLTSPAISLNGTKIAVVESQAAASVFHVVTWSTGAGNGTTATTAAVPGTGNTAAMTSLAYAAATNSNSSPYIDYSADVAYVGADDGKLYKIVNVFGGTPALAGAPWPVTVTAGATLTGPVFDTVSGKIFIGDSKGDLKMVTAATGVLSGTSLLVGSTNRDGGLVDPPIVDSSNATVFAFSANDGTSAVVVEADTSLTQLIRVNVGKGSVGATVANAVNLHAGAFTTAYFTSPSIGQLVVCGTDPANTTPALYLFNFTGKVINPVSTIGNFDFLGTGLPGTECSPLTLFPTAGADTLYVSVPKNCGGGGCVQSYQGAGLVASVSESGGTSGIIIDNSSAQNQASSIYFSTLGPTKNAVKLTQVQLR